ncbi:MAG: MFS transporter [Planctomycetota bacterium]|nr:MFS transporter [Planctomycetota bacterium]
MNPGTHTAGSRTGLLLLAAGLAQFICCADYFAVAVALPPMAKELGVRAIDLQWVITGYILCFCATLCVAGVLGDRYGRKRLLLVGIVIFAVVSVWVGLGQTATEVVIARIALGLGAGLLFPLATAVVGNASTPDTISRNIALLTGVATLGTALGPVLGGVLTEALNWRWIFFANVPISLVAFIMVLCFARESRDPDHGARLDPIGIILLMGGIAAFSVGIDRIPHRSVVGWLSLTLGGLALLVVFFLLQLRSRAPVIDVRLFRNRDFLGFSTVGLLSNSAWCGLVLIATLQLQKVLGFSVLDAGLYFLFLSGSIATASFTAPLLERRIGVVRLLRLALGLQTVGIGVLFLVDDVVWLSIGMLVAGFGCSWGWALPQAGAIRSLPAGKVGLASGSVLTIMILSGNTAFVLVAMLVDLFPDDPAGEARGIAFSALFMALVALAGLVGTVVLLRRLRHA